MVAILLANGFEEIEALCPADLLMRASHEVKLVSITNEKRVVGTHGIALEADMLISELNKDSVDLLFLPGGMPGAENLYASEALRELVLYQSSQKKPLAAICAAPLVLGRLGILSGKRATCYPGFEAELSGALLSTLPTVRDENILTGAGMGASFELGLSAIDMLDGRECAERIRHSTMIDGK